MEAKKKNDIQDSLTQTGRVTASRTTPVSSFLYIYCIENGRVDCVALILYRCNDYMGYIYILD
jgi:hypothetical protein